MLVYDEMVPRHFWRIAIVTWVLTCRDSEIRGEIVRMAKTNTILKRSVNKSNLLIRFNKAREIISSVTRVLSILLTTAATTASVERVNSKECV